MRKIEITETPEELANSFALYFCDLARTYKSQDKNMHVALSGGSTPKIWFKLLVQKFKTSIPWDIIHFYWGDERMVPAEHAESNYGEAKRLLFDHINIPEQNIHPVEGSNSIDDEINRYNNIISSNIACQKNFPEFDLIILGMGDDGHTASIFPHQMDLLNSKAMCAKAIHPQSGQIRLSLTGSLINCAHNIAFLITGANKAEKLEHIMEQDARSKEYPATYINPKSGNLLFYLDQQAASKLK